jgi:arginase
MQTVAESAAVLVDGRDLDPQESEAVAGSGMTVLSVGEVVRWEPPPGPLYVHVDVDVVDPADMPAMGYPAPNGPSLAAVQEAVRHLAGTGRVAAFSMSLWNPDLPGADAASVASAALAEPFAFFLTASQPET